MGILTFSIQLAFSYTRMQLLPALMNAFGEAPSAIKLSKQLTSGRRRFTCTASSLVKTMGKPRRVTFTEEECEAVNLHLGEEVVTPQIKVERFSRAVIDGGLYHSTTYLRTTRTNNYTIAYQDMTEMHTDRFGLMFE